PETLVPVGVQPAFLDELGEGGRLVVAAVGEAVDRFLREDVDAAVHPVRDPATLAEADDNIVVSEVDDAERRLRPGDRNGRSAPRLPVPREQRAKVDDDELVAVHGLQAAGLRSLPRGDLEPAAAAEQLGL